MEGGDPSKYFSPEIEDVLEFGDNSQSWDVEFPSKENKMELKDKNIYLTTIRYKFDKFSPERFMTAIEFEYDDGNTGPKLQTEPSRLVDWKQFNISKSAAVRKVSMAVDADTGGVVGIRLLDRRNNKIVEETWNGSSISSAKLGKMWEDESIGNGERIIGFKASANENHIDRFAWIIWDP